MQTLQSINFSEKHELAKNKDQLDGKILETEETIRLVKRKVGFIYLVILV